MAIKTKIVCDACGNEIPRREDGLSVRVNACETKHVHPGGCVMELIERYVLDATFAAITILSTIQESDE